MTERGKTESPKNESHGSTVLNLGQAQNKKTQGVWLFVLVQSVTVPVGHIYLVDWTSKYQ